MHGRCTADARQMPGGIIPREGVRRVASNRVPLSIPTSIVGAYGRASATPTPAPTPTPTQEPTQRPKETREAPTKQRERRARRTWKTAYERIVLLAHRALTGAAVLGGTAGRRPDGRWPAEGCCRTRVDAGRRAGGRRRAAAATGHPAGAAWRRRRENTEGRAGRGPTRLPTVNIDGHRRRRLRRRRATTARARPREGAADG